MKKDLAIAGLMHDLNNVLHAIAQAADILSTDPEWSELAESIIASVDRGRMIVLSASEAPSHVNLASVARRASSASRMAIELQIPPGLGFAGRPMAIERALTNLLLNSEQAGATTFHLTASAGSAIRIETVDNGSGIPADLLSSIFHAGVSGSNSTGLGLHIVETIIQEHGGTIQAENQAGGSGAKFIIHIPIGPA